MSTRIYVGIDNGVTGSIGVVSNRHSAYQMKTPVVKELYYTKKKAFMTWIDFEELLRELGNLMYDENVKVFVGIERPMINPTRFKATISAVCAWQATLLALKFLKIPYEYIDSKEWQKALLPAGLEKEELKQASMDIARRLYPTARIEGADADGLLIAEHMKRKHGENHG
jgi:hypothetical protein